MRALGFFSFRGRTGRAGFWLGAAILAPSLVALFIILYAYSMSFPGAYENGGPTPWPSDPLGMALAIAWFAALAAVLIGSLAVTIRRLHDRGKAWWWIVPFVVLPNALYAGAQYLMETTESPGNAVPFLLEFGYAALTLWALIELGFLRGSHDDNPYGPDPAP
jgi:uncharacterized membrane protein YhaH (DUF805 family)